MPRKLTATIEGKTVTRTSARPYTHCVVGLFDSARRADQEEAQAAEAEKMAETATDTWSPARTGWDGTEFPAKLLSTAAQNRERSLEFAGRLRRFAAECRAKGDFWKAVSWHQGEANARNGYATAQRDNVHRRYSRLELVPVNETTGAAK